MPYRPMATFSVPREDFDAVVVDPGRIAPERTGRAEMKRRSAWTVWAAALAVTATAAAPTVLAILAPGVTGSEMFSAGLWVLVPSVFALSAAIILSHQPRNVIGWLLMIPAVSVAVDNVIVAWFDSFASSTPDMSPGVFAALLLNNYSWLLLIFPLFHLLQVFPTGSPLSRGWRWFIRLEYAMAVFLLVIGSLTAEVGPFDGRWSITNPIGVVPVNVFDGVWFGATWTIGLLLLALGGAASVVTRYRRSRGEERLQLKWLLYAFSQFVVVYSATALLEDGGSWDTVEEDLFNVFFIVSILAIPVVIAMVVLRRGLFGIDRVISRTVSYAMLVGALVGVYAFGVGLLTRLLPAQSDLAVAASTLAVAALFNPLRRSIQRRVDRRFNRNRYRADQELTALSDRLHAFADIGVIVTDLMSVADRTIQPRSVAVWIAGDAGQPPTAPRRR